MRVYLQCPVCGKYARAHFIGSAGHHKLLVKTVKGKGKGKGFKNVHKAITELDDLKALELLDAYEEALERALNQVRTLKESIKPFIKGRTFIRSQIWRSHAILYEYHRIGGDSYVREKVFRETVRPARVRTRIV